MAFDLVKFGGEGFQENLEGGHAVVICLVDPVVNLLDLPLGKVAFPSNAKEWLPS